MLKRLRRKMVVIIMSVVSVILLAIFLTLLLTSKSNNEKLSLSILEAALNGVEAAPGPSPPISEAGPPQPPEGLNPQMRQPVLVIDYGSDGSIMASTNQLHFIAADQIEPISIQALAAEEDLGVLSEYGLRYLRRTGPNGVRIALTDISVEQEMLRTQVRNSLLVGGPALLVFFFLSIVLARWAVRPVEVAWNRQRQFIANASHELKTPLTVILSNAAMLQEEDIADSKNARRVDHINAEALRMKHLLEDMLILARSDSGEEIAVPLELDFSYIVKTAVLTYEPLIFDAKKRLTYEIEEGLFVKAVESDLEQVIHILLDNAQKYSSAGALIDVKLKKGEQRTALLQVSNEGEPIAKGELERLFLRFYRRDESRTDSGSFGLGLAIAESLISKYKGKIRADSDGASVNSFYVTLPLA